MPVLIAALATLVGVLLAGCGDKTPATNGPTGSDNPTTSATDGNNADNDSDASDGDSDKDDNDLLAGFDPTSPKQPIRVTYKTDDGNMTMSWDGTNSAIITDDGSFITTKDATYICSDGQCIKSPSTSGDASAAGGMAAFFTMFSALKDAQPNLFSDKSSATIAGRSATCVTFDAAKLAAAFGGDTDDATGKASFCWDNKSGVVLRVASDDATDNLEATEVGSPKDSDFKPTGPVQELPTAAGS